MNEPKRRGRPPKQAADQRTTWQTTEIEVEGPVVSETVHLNPEQYTRQQSAQAYAMRVWAGQSESLGRGERVKRIQAALEGQGLSMDGVKLPGESQDDGGEWTEEDMKPVVWRSNRTAA